MSNKKVEVVKTPQAAVVARHDASRSTSTVSIYRVIENVNREHKEQREKIEAQVMRSYTGLPAAIPANAWTSAVSVAGVIGNVNREHMDLRTYRPEKGAK